ASGSRPGPLSVVFPAAARASFVLRRETRAMLHRPAVPATSCSALSRRLAEPLPGTAPTATAWICLEQPGPGGRDALSQSHLDRAFGRELARRAKAVGIRAVLIRRPGPHADRRVPEPRQVYLAGTRPGAVWLEEALVD